MTTEELEKLVKLLQDELNILKESVARLTTQVSDDFLQKLQDVKIESLTFGDVLQYDSDGKWHNIQPSSLKISVEGSGNGSSTLAGLTDVMVTNVGNGQVLTYDSLSSKWINKSVSTGGTTDMSKYLTKTEASTMFLPMSGGSIDWLIVKGVTEMKANANVAGDLLVNGGITMYNN